MTPHSQRQNSAFVTRTEPPSWMDRGFLKFTG